MSVAVLKCFFANDAHQMEALKIAGKKLSAEKD